MNQLAWTALSVAALVAVVPGCDASPAAQSSLAATEVSSNSPSPVAGGRVRSITFDDIKFDMESNDQFVDEMITPAIEKQLDQRLRLTGYMFPTLRDHGLTRFVLVRDNLECCFGPGAALYDCVLVYMRDGDTADYSVRQVTVEGQFRFEKLQAGPEGPLMAIYRLDDALVR